MVTIGRSGRCDHGLAYRLDRWVDISHGVNPILPEGDCFTGSSPVVGLIRCQPETGPRRPHFGTFRLLRPDDRDKPFGPSAIQRVPNHPDQFIVVNDKTRSAGIFRLSHVTTTPSLIQIAKIDFAAEITGRFQELETKKFEAITGFKGVAYGAIYLMTSFDRDEAKNQRLIEVVLSGDDTMPKEAVGATGDTQTVPAYWVPSRYIEILAPVDGVNVVHPDTKRVKVEALASSSSGQLLVGLRALFDANNSATYRVFILAYEVQQLENGLRSFTAPRRIIDVDLSTMSTGLKSKLEITDAEGISSLTYVPEQEIYLLLTSRETPTEPESSNRLGGHLWKIPKALLENPDDCKKLNHADAWEPYCIATFSGHKPEGVDWVPSPGNQSGHAIVVCDDDDDHPGNDLKQAVFALIPISK